jgi:Glycosyl hydrolase family 26
MAFRDRAAATRGRRRAVKAALGLTLAVTVGFLPALPGVSLSPAQASTKWQSGVYTGQCGPKPVAAFGVWRKAPAERTSGYLAAKTWKDLYTISGLTTCLHRAGVPVTLSVPMFPGTVKKGKSESNLIRGAEGKYNAYWAKFGKALVAGGYAKATLRIGWEMNGSWFSWSADKDPKHWKAYWIQIVKTLRKVDPKFTYEWAPALGSGTGHFDVASAYPGSAYVTYIGSTVYDQWFGEPNKTPAQIWANLNNTPFGLKWLASFAKAHHKKIAISEWGLASSASFNGGGGGDDPFFITHFYAWMKRSNVVYEIYFNRRHKNTTGPAQINEHRLTIGTKTNPIFKNAAKVYKQYFGGG